MLNRLLTNHRGAESTEFIVVVMIVVAIMLFFIVALINRTQTAAGEAKTALDNCVPGAVQTGQWTSCQ